VAPSPLTPPLTPFKSPREALPVELTERALRDVVAVIGEWDEDGARAAQSALEWLGWDEESPLRLRRYDVQLFAWYTLPRKFLASLQVKRETVQAVAETLERLGGRAASYAEVCRLKETDELLCAWEAEDPRARTRFRELLDSSGIEPPDTELIAWGSVMGLQEALVRDEVATALEEAIEDGRLSPGAPGFRRRQAEVAEAALHEPADTDPAVTRLEAVRSERVERWITRGNTRGGPERSAIIEPVAGLISGGQASVDAGSAAIALAPAIWLLEQAADGIALTQTGALNRALVREVAERWPDWWSADLFGPPNREDDVTLLWELDELLRGMRLLRREGRQIVSTKRGCKLKADPAALLLALARQLLVGDDFRAGCAELAAALILDGALADYSAALAERVHPAIVAEGWRDRGEPPDANHVSWRIADFLRPAEAIGLFERGKSDSRWKSGPLILTDVGRAALIYGLRERALSPARGPY
jgi:hypothetical protein